MKEKLIDKKSKILTIITKEEYEIVIDFFLKILLSEYELMIFDSDILSNLFLAIKQLILEEELEQLSLTGKNLDLEKASYSKVGISRDCLDWFCLNRRVRSVLIIDDTIIHERKIRSLHKIVKGKYPDAEIKVLTFMEIDDRPIGMKNISVESFQVVNYMGLKRFKTVFLDILMLLNRPNNQYFPVLSLMANQREKANDIYGEFNLWIKENRKYFYLYNQGSPKMPILESRFWVGKSICRNIICSGLRVYHNLENDDFAIIPMLLMKPISQEILLKQLVALSKVGIFTKDYAIEYLKVDKKISRIDYHVLVYTLSILWGNLFFYKKFFSDSIIDIDYDAHTEEEHMYFGCDLLDMKRIIQLEQDEIMDILIKLEDLFVSADINELNSRESLANTCGITIFDSTNPLESYSFWKECFRL